MVFKNPCLLEIHNEIQIKNKVNTGIKLSKLKSALQMFPHERECVSPEGADTKPEFPQSKHGVYLASPDLPWKSPACLRVASSKLECDVVMWKVCLVRAFPLGHSPLARSSPGLSSGPVFGESEQALRCVSSKDTNPVQSEPSDLI